MARINKSNLAHKHALMQGWAFRGFNSRSHREYEWTDSDGDRHRIVIGNGMHHDSDPILDLRHTRSRIRMCQRKECYCMRRKQSVASG